MSSTLFELSTKFCTWCGQEKPRDQFYADKNRRDGLYPHCKTCHNQRTKRWNENNRDRRRELDRIRYHAGDKLRKKHEKRLRKYGLARAEFDALLEQQHGVCAICELPFVDDGSSGNWDLLSVDHDHTTGKVRGLLHRRCNLALELGLTAEDWKRAEKYLASHIS